jgi:hypothetical protein
MAGLGEQLEPDERQAVARLMDAAADALNDRRLDEHSVWPAVGIVAAALELAGGDVRAGGHARLLDGAATRLGEHVDEIVRGRREPPSEGGGG